MKAALAVLGVLVLVGCKDKPDDSLLQGRWVTSNMSQFSRDGGVKMAYVFGADGRFRHRRYFANEDSSSKAFGDGIPYSVSGNVITFSPPDHSWKEEFTISDHTLTLKITEVNGGNPDFLGVTYVFEKKEKE